MGVGEIETPTGQRKEPGPKSALGRLRDLILRRTRENWEWYFALRIVYDSGVPLNTKLWVRLAEKVTWEVSAAPAPCDWFWKSKWIINLFKQSHGEYWLEFSQEIEKNSMHSFNYLLRAYKVLWMQSWNTDPTLSEIETIIAISGAATITNSHKLWVAEMINVCSRVFRLIARWLILDELLWCH